MKKNIIIGILATVFAVGSAFATLAPVPTGILAKIAPTAPFTCQRCSSLACDNSGPFPCIIQVNTTLSGVKLVPGRFYPQCQPILTHTSSAPLFCPVTFFDAM